jgi:hypothetical protein
MKQLQELGKKNLSIEKTFDQSQPTEAEKSTKVVFGISSELHKAARTNIKVEGHTMKLITSKETYEEAQSKKIPHQLASSGSKKELAFGTTAPSRPHIQISSNKKRRLIPNEGPNITTTILGGLGVSNQSTHNFGPQKLNGIIYDRSCAANTK